MTQTNFVPPPSMPPKRRRVGRRHAACLRHAHRYHHRSGRSQGDSAAACRVCRRRDADTLPRMNRARSSSGPSSPRSPDFSSASTPSSSPGAEQTIQSLWGLSAGVHGLAMGAALYGTVLGSLFGGWPTDRFGRKQTLICHRRPLRRVGRRLRVCRRASARSSPPASSAGWASASRRSPRRSTSRRSPRRPTAAAWPACSSSTSSSASSSPSRRTPSSRASAARTRGAGCSASPRCRP